MRLKAFALGLLACAAAMTVRASFADTLTLSSTSGTAVGGVYVYPYNFSLNGASQTTPMMCISYQDEVTLGETWQVTGQKLSTLSSLAFRENAWLFSQLGTGKYSASDIQFAVWDILDPGTPATATSGGIAPVGGNPGYNAVAQGLVSMASSAVSGLGDSFYSQYTILAPVTTAQAQLSWTAGTPQSFIVQTSAVTAEPSSILLLGTGLVGAGLLILQRRKVAEEQPVQTS